MILGLPRLAYPVFNDVGSNGLNGGALTANGNFCTILAPIIPPLQQKSGPNSSTVIDLASYAIGGGTATGSINFQAVLPDLVTWFTLQSPATLALATTPLTGILNGPFLGLRIVLSALAVSTVPFALLVVTFREL